MIIIGKIFEVFTMKIVVITGANGFIGRNLIRRLLKEECYIYAVDISHKESIFTGNKNIELIECSLDNISHLTDLISAHEIDVFYHFAWDGSTGAARGDYNKQLKNVQYTCDAALVSKNLNSKRFITTGSISERIVNDALANNYLSQNIVYAIAKNTAHNILNIICNKNDIPYCWVQLSNIFGGDNKNGNLISYTLEEIKKGNVPEYGPCDQPYDFLYIKDTIEALVKIGFAQHCRNAYFIGSGKPRVLREYLDEISRKLNKPIGIGVKPSDGVIYKKEWFDTVHLKNDLDYTPQYSFESAIDEITKEI